MSSWTERVLNSIADNIIREGREKVNKVMRDPYRGVQDRLEKVQGEMKLMEETIHWAENLPPKPPLSAGFWARANYRRSPSGKDGEQARVKLAELKPLYETLTESIVSKNKNWTMRKVEVALGPLWQELPALFQTVLTTPSDLYVYKAAVRMCAIKELQRIRRELEPNYIEELQSWDKSKVKTQLKKYQRELEELPLEIFTEEVWLDASFIYSIFVGERQFLKDMIIELEELLTQPQKEPQTPADRLADEALAMCTTRLEAERRFALIEQAFPEYKEAIRRKLRTFLDELEDRG